MKKRIAASILYLTLTFPIPISLSGCGAKIQASDLMSGIKADKISADIDIAGEGAQAAADFSVRLFQNCIDQEKNTLISPLSVLQALAMTANGAKGSTLSQMEDLFGMPVHKLNEYLHTYTGTLPSDKNYKLSLANSIWFKDDDSFTVNKDFLQSNANWYGADIYKAPFDASTLKDINSWVSENTDGMVKDILDEIPDEAVMYLVNALAFDAKWETEYKESQVRDGIFTREDGTEQAAELMYSREYQYLEDEKAEGFIKYYKDRKYAFAALLPNEGVSITDYIASLRGEKLCAILNDSKNIQVNAAVPKFESEYLTEMSKRLQKMGVIDAFDGMISDFSGIGSSSEGNLAISRVLHKTYIAVDESGTKAGAATAVEMKSESASAEPEEIKTVYLDRPFVYMLIDCETNLPIFMGTLMSIA